MCGSIHSRLFGPPTDRAVCADCGWEAAGVTALCWALHHHAKTGHAVGLVT